MRTPTNTSQRASRPALRRVYLVVLATMAVWGSGLAHAQADGAQVQFESQFLRGAAQEQVDVSRFERGNLVSPGSYDVELYLNGNSIGRTRVRFAAQEGSGSATMCLDKQLVERMAVNTAVLGESQRTQLAKLDSDTCVLLADLVAGATYTYDPLQFRLDLSIPQAALLRNPQGWVNPELWQTGVTSATLGYNVNSYRFSSGGATSSQTYVGLNGGVNVGNWHLRHDGSLSLGSDGTREYQNVATYVQHDLPSIRGQLTVGDAFTDGTVFDSIGIRGVELASDDRMLPDSMRGYAPVIRGVANSNARVTVTQNGNKLYETTVAPGAFEIDDLYATGYGGDLLVTVTEADGSEHSFTVPYAAVTQLLRAGATRYEFTAGQLRDAQIGSHPSLFQATVQHGFNNLITGYAGTVGAQGYLAALMGTGLNTPVGAFSLDLTHARTDLPGASVSSGQSLRLGYSKNVESTGTNLTVGAYRYSSDGYLSLRDAMMMRDYAMNGQSTDQVLRQRGQLQITMSQSLGEHWGSAYLSGSALHYWNQSGTTMQFQAGYSNTARIAGTNIAYNLSLSRQRDNVDGSLNNQVFASVSIPLGKTPHAPQLSTNVASGDNASVQTMLTGTTGADNQFSYGVNASQTAGSPLAGGSVQYRSPYALLGMSASGGPQTSQVSANASGAVVAHPGGVTLANSMGDTIAVVEAKGAEGARVENAPGVRVDAQGYAVVPYVTPYQLNTISLNPTGLPTEVQLKSTSEQVAPRANSVVMVHFDTVTGRSAMITAKQPNGAAVPFGADVFDASGTNVGVVGQDGLAFVSGVTDEGALTMKWGDGADESCPIHYRLPPKGGDQDSYARTEAVCGTSSAGSAPAAGTTNTHIAAFGNQVEESQQ